MKLWKISQTQNGGYDTFDSAVVAAETEDAARNTPPSKHSTFDNEWSGWCNDPRHVKVVYLGEADRDLKPGVIVASFNAG